MAAGGDFDAAYYLRENPDVAEAGLDPLEHYLRHGAEEGRKPNGLAAIGFDPDYYVRAYRDAAQSDLTPAGHYLAFGRHEGRHPNAISAAKAAARIAGFDAAYYLRENPDVAESGLDPLEHYVRCGVQEERAPSELASVAFDSAYYLRQYPDVGRSGLEAGEHYLAIGRREGRHPNAFSAANTDWERLWRTGFLYPKGGQKFDPNAALGTPGMPKILFTGHATSRSGAPLILLSLMKAIQSLTGAELYLILEKGEKADPLFEEYQRIAHVFLNREGQLYPPTSLNFGTLLRSIATPVPAVAICNSACSWSLLRILREAGLQNLISLIHERFVHFPRGVWRLIYQHSDRVIFPADAVKAAVTATMPEYWKGYVLPQGLHRHSFGRGDRITARREVRNNLGLSPDTRIILGCGTQDMRKGVDLFVQLAARVCADAAQNVHFVWLGAVQRGTLFAKLVDLDIDILNLSSRVTLLDEVTDPEPYFLAADAFAMTSRDDPFPCVVQEAMACALPVVAFEGSGGAKEALADGCGVVVPYLDIDAMARALTSVVDKPWEYAEMGQRAESRVHSLYVFAKYAERIWEICEDVIGQRAASEAQDSRGPTAKVA
jgi:glycosyltransferase involved in cell wall biosynthesis